MQRKDKKGRNLKAGESQRTDGSYMYKYKNHQGKWKYVYSWRLTKSDPTPAGKKKTLSLREKEEKISELNILGITDQGNKITVLDLTLKYVSLKNNTKDNTKKVYNAHINLIRNSDLGNMKINVVDEIAAKEFFIELNKSGKSYNTVCLTRAILRPAFKLAKRSLWIKNNPFDFSLSEVLIKDAKKRGALSELEETNLLEFIRKTYSDYYDEIYLLFNTGLRISEFVGLTESDIDFENKILNVDHQLLRFNGGYKIETTKSKAGERKIPLSDETLKHFKNIVNKNKEKKKDNDNIEPTVDNYSNFLCLTKQNQLTTVSSWNYLFKKIIKEYNVQHQQKLPEVTPHWCRHTFCTKMVRLGVTPKTLQYLMGHSNIGVTMNIYSHINVEDVKAELASLQI